MEIHRNVVNPEIPFQMEQRGAYLICDTFLRLRVARCRRGGLSPRKYWSRRGVVSKRNRACLLVRFHIADRGQTLVNVA
jgi:hypothetical protein